MCETLNALRDLEPFVQFKKREKNPLRRVKCQAEACNFTRNNTPPWVISRLSNRTNVTKSHKASHI